MKATTKLESGSPATFECEIFTGVEGLYARAEEFKKLGYEVSASIEYDSENNESCCLYSLEKLSDTGGSVMYLFKDNKAITDLKNIGRSEDIIMAGLISDFIHFTMLSRSGAKFKDMNELFSMLDECEDEGIGLDIQWSK